MTNEALNNTTEVCFAGAYYQAKFDANTVDVNQLQTIPGITKRDAQRFVDSRERAGGFSSAVQMRRVQGIGLVKYKALRQNLYLCLTPQEVQTRRAEYLVDRIRQLSESDAVDLLMKVFEDVRLNRSVWGRAGTAKKW